MSVNSRQRMIQSAVLLMRERGVEATSFSDVLQHSGSPRGSIYHHFPGGKAQLIEEATRYAGDYMTTGLASALAASDPASALETCAAFWRGVLRDSGCASGCPIVAATVDGSAGALDAAAAAFARWEALLSDALEHDGIDPESARTQSTLMIAAIEGAVILSRAQRSSAPLERVADELVRQTRVALSASPGAETPKGS
jgi:AcrR family transcriptional regulator